jgi:hypothetical protein
VDGARIEQVREVLRWIDVDGELNAALDDDMPPAIATFQREVNDAYESADIEWILEHTDPAVEIVQPREIPDTKSYSGLDGLLDALLDWPLQWERFQIQPRRIFALDDEHVVNISIHRGRPRQVDLEVEAEIVWLFRWNERRLMRWDMFLTMDEALEAAQKRR